MLIILLILFVLPISFNFPLRQLLIIYMNLFIVLVLQLSCLSYFKLPIVTLHLFSPFLDFLCLLLSLMLN